MAVDAVTGDCWQDEAECGKPHVRDSVDMFDEQGEGVWYAKAICAACPVTVQCLELALANRERYGVWGGLDTAERERLRKGGR